MINDQKLTANVNRLSQHDHDTGHAEHDSPPHADAIRHAHEAAHRGGSHRLRLGFDETAWRLGRIRTHYIHHRFAFVPGEDMIPILRALGATQRDIHSLHHAGDRLGADPTLPFRHSRNGRFEMDFSDRMIRRLEFQPFILTEDEDFVRHDSGQVRHFRGIEDEVQCNTAFQALARFQAIAIEGVNVHRRPHLDYDANSFVSTVFHLRTISTRDLLGEPAAEGVHSDGVDHTMTTFLGSQNMRADSAVSDLHEMTQRNGITWDETDPTLIVASAQHRHPFDTLLIVDNELKHTVSPIHPDDPAHHASRDMLIFFTRRPTTEDHASHPYDSLCTHPECPVEFDMH